MSNGAGGQTIYGNLVYGPARGIDLDANESLDGAWTVYNNTIVDSSVWGISMGGTETGDTHTIQNNLISNSGTAPLRISSGQLDTTIGGYNQWDTTDSPDVPASYTNTGTADDATTPTFNSVGSDQYWLQSGSAGVDDGLDITGTTYDNMLLKASTWPNGVSLGAQPSYGSGHERGAYIFEPL
jgi:hypothetical protein